MVCGLAVSGAGERVSERYIIGGWVYGGGEFTLSKPSDLVCISVVVPLYSQAGFWVSKRIIKLYKIINKFLEQIRIDIV